MKKKPLEKVCLMLRSGGTPQTGNPLFYGGEIPFVTIDDMTSSFRYISTTTKTITPLGLQNSNCWLVPKGSILYSIYATLGVSRINQKEVATNQAILALIPDPEEVDTDFLFYYLSYLKDQIHRLSAQTTQSNLSAKIVKNFEIPLFDLVSQKAIADVLSTVDQTITQTEALIAKYQRIKTGLMQDLLTRGIDENGNLRDPDTHEFKDVEGYGRVPIEWETETLGDTGLWLSGGTPKKNNDVFWRNGTIPWVTPKDMKTFYITDSIDHVTELGMQSGTRLIPENTVLIVVRGMILAHTFPVAITGRSVTFNQDMKAIITKPSLHAQYLGYWFASKESQMLSITTESTHGTKRFDLDDLQSYPIALPPIPEQKQIITILETQTRLKKGLAEQLIKLNSLKQGLMQDLLTGKVSVAPLLETQEGR